MNAKLTALLQLTPRQKALALRHGTPPEFAAAVWRGVPGDISSDEARAAIHKYWVEWEAAGRIKESIPYPKQRNKNLESRMG